MVSQRESSSKALIRRIAGLVRVEAIVKLHGTRPWHLSQRRPVTRKSH